MARFIEDEGIKCAPVYYDADGTFHPERRLGCIGCPMKSDCGRSDYIKYPGMLRELIRRGKKYLLSHPDCSANEKFGDAYNMVFHNLFFDSYDSYESAVTGGLFPETAIDAKEYLEEYFKIDLTL